MKRAEDVCARMELAWKDITTLEVDAIVNAANPGLQGGGGVDGSIHWAAGSELLEACRGLGGCPTGEARLTPGFRLPARFVIHTVGPVYGLDPHAEDLLRACYRNSLLLAVEHRLASVAFPAISCGVYRFPVEKACAIAIETVRDFLMTHALPEKVIFAVYSLAHYEIYRATLAKTC